MRTPEEMVERIEWLMTTMIGPMTIDDVLQFLPFEFAKKYLKKEITENDWEKAKSPYTTEYVKHEIADYVGFAWEKASDERGLSAARSMMHFANWFWLLGEDAMEKMTKNYVDYGKSTIEKIAEWAGLKDEDYKGVDHGR